MSNQSKVFHIAMEEGQAAVGRSPSQTNILEDAHEHINEGSLYDEASSDTTSVSSDTETEDGTTEKGNSCRCVGNPEQFFSRFGGMIAMLSTCMASVTSLLSSLSSGNLNAALINIIILGAIQGPTTCALVYFFFKEPVKALLRLWARCVAMWMARKRRQAQKLASYVEGVVNTGMDTLDIRQMSRSKDSPGKLVDSTSREFVRSNEAFNEMAKNECHMYSDFDEKYGETYQNTMFISGKGDRSDLNFTSVEERLSHNALDVSSKDSFTRIPRQNNRDLDSIHFDNSMIGDKISEIMLDPSKFTNHEFFNKDKSGDSTFKSFTNETLENVNVQRTKTKSSYEKHITKGQKGDRENIRSFSRSIHDRDNFTLNCDKKQSTANPLNLGTTSETKYPRRINICRSEPHLDQKETETILSCNNVFANGAWNHSHTHSDILSKRTDATTLSSGLRLESAIESDISKTTQAKSSNVQNNPNAHKKIHRPDSRNNYEETRVKITCQGSDGISKDFVDEGVDADNHMTRMRPLTHHQSGTVRSRRRRLTASTKMLYIMRRMCLQ